MAMYNLESPKHNKESSQTYYQVSEKEFENNLAKSRKFCKTVEINLNNYIKNDALFNPSKPSNTYYLSIESINGIKKEQKVIFSK